MNWKKETKKKVEENRRGDVGETETENQWKEKEKEEETEKERRNEREEHVIRTRSTIIYRR